MAFPSESLGDVIRVIGELREKENFSRRALEEGQPLETAYRF